MLIAETTASAGTTRWGEKRAESRVYALTARPLSSPLARKKYGRCSTGNVAR